MGTGAELCSGWIPCSWVARWDDLVGVSRKRRLMRRLVGHAAVAAGEAQFVVRVGMRCFSALSLGRWLKKRCSTPVAAAARW